MLSLRSIRLRAAGVGFLAGMTETCPECWRCCSLADASQAQHDKSLFFTQSLIHSVKKACHAEPAKHLPKSSRRFYPYGNDRDLP